MVRLRAFEDIQRRAIDFRTQPPSDDVTGPDPVALSRLPSSPLLVGLLRGRAAVVLLDASLRERSRDEAPPAPCALAVTPAGDVLVAGDLGGDVWRYRLRDGRLARDGAVPLGGVRAVRAIAYGPEGVLYVAEEHDHRVLTLALDAASGAGAGTPGATVARPGAVLDAAGGLGLAPRVLLRTARHLVVDYVLSHTVAVMPVDARGIPDRARALRITHDGPIWALDAQEDSGGLVLALGGVEDRPLDRRQGSFGHVDSYVFLYRADLAAGHVKRLAETNVSKLGVVTPKVVRLRVTGRDVTVRTTGYGDATVAELGWTDPRPTSRGTWPEPTPVTRQLVPGTVAEVELPGGRRVLADPLLDAWVADDGAAVRIVPVADAGRPRRSLDVRVGEALFFTTAMAPWNRTRGALSRFTCETCHTEGHVDGRVHHTGRGDVRVTTRPLVGLGNARPYFSRALDPDLATMVDNEFAVAGRRSRHDPWFSLGTADLPWFALLGSGRARLSPEDLRRALMTFLLAFAPRPNPSALGRTAWSAEERRGAEVFRGRCEDCHQARLIADEPGTRIAPDDWERLVLSREGPIVWARATRERSGVEPYVHEDGARVPSLRRLARKRPYFTNGSARDLDELLRRVRFAPGGFRHDGAADGGEPLADTDRRALLAFLDLL